MAIDNASAALEPTTEAEESSELFERRLIRLAEYLTRLEKSHLIERPMTRSRSCNW